MRYIPINLRFYLLLKKYCIDVIWTLLLLARALFPIQIGSFVLFNPPKVLANKVVDIESKAGSMMVRNRTNVKLVCVFLACPHTRSMGFSSQWNFNKNVPFRPSHSRRCSTIVFLDAKLAKIFRMSLALRVAVFIPRSLSSFPLGTPLLVEVVPLQASHSLFWNWGHLVRRPDDSYWSRTQTWQYVCPQGT